MFGEDDLLPISALQHLLFCPRQCALIHVERLWADNRLTVEGTHLHRQAHDGPTESRPNVVIVRGLLLRSLRLGLVGQADVVEYHRHDPRLAGRRPTPTAVAAGGWQVVPVEYKRGQPKPDDSDRVQLCAQALCLEEMNSCEIISGALFYGRRRRRTPVAFDEDLRSRTFEAVERLHTMICEGRTPPADRAPKCDRCSLIDLCLPSIAAGRQSALRFADHQFDQSIVAAGPASDPFEPPE